MKVQGERGDRRDKKTSEELFKLIRKNNAEIGSQSEREQRLQQARIEPGQPVCTTCTGMARSTARSTVAKERSIDMVDRLKGLTLG